MEKTIEKYIERLNTLKENRAETTETNSDADNELYDRLINQVAEFIRDMKAVNVGLADVKDCGTCKSQAVSKYIEPCYGCRDNGGYDNYSNAIDT